MKKSAVLGILAAMVALGTVLATSGGVYAIAGPGSVHITNSVNAPGSRFSDVTSGSAEGVAYADMRGSSSGLATSSVNSAATNGGESGAWGTAEIWWYGEGTVTSTSSATANGTSVAQSNADSEIGSHSSGTVIGIANSTADGDDSYADTQAVTVLDDDSSGAANSLVNAKAMNGGIARAYTISEVGDNANGTANTVANATATNGGFAQAYAVSYIESDTNDNVTAYAYATSTGSVAYANTILTNVSGASSTGFFWGVYVSGDSYALAFLYIPTPDNITGFTFANAGTTDAYADIEVHGSDITVIASGVLPP